MKHFLRRKSSKVVNGEDKNNKNNTKIGSLAVIEDNEPQIQQSNGNSFQDAEGSFMPQPNRRTSIAETVDSTSTTDSKKKEGYRARLAAQSQQEAQFSPWMAMSSRSHSVMTTAPSKPKPKPKPKSRAEGSIISAGQSTESVPASIVSTIPINITPVEAPAAPPSPSYPPPDVPSSANSPRRSRSPSGSPMGLSHIGIASSSGFPSSSRTSLVVPPSPSVYVTPPSLPPKPPPAGPLPQLPMPGPLQQPVMVAPMGPLANPFRTEAPISYHENTGQTSPVRPPPPPPPPPAAPPKLQRNPSRGMPPPSAFVKHKRTFSGRVSPNPSLPNLPIPPPPPPPPPAAAGPASAGPSSGAPNFPVPSDRDSVVSPLSPGTHFRNESLSNFPEPPSAARSQRSSSWDDFVPDLTGYYGGPAPFVAELDTIPTFPEPPSGNPNFEQQELDVTSPSHDEMLQAAEDKRETSKVILPEGMSLYPVLPTPSDTSTSRNDSIFSNPSDVQPKMTDGIFLSNSEHAALLSDLSDLRARLADLDKLHANSLDRISEWEAYKANIDIYVEKTAQDRQGLIDKLQNSAQAHSTVIAEKERQFNELATTANTMKQTMIDWQTYSQKLEADRAEASTQVAQLSGQIESERIDHARAMANITNQLEREKSDNLANIQAMEVAHNDEVNRYKMAHAADMHRLNADHTAELDRIRADHTSERNRFTIANDSARAEYEQQKSELMGQLATADSQKKELMPKLVELDNIRRKLQGELAEANADKDGLQQQIRALTTAKESTSKELQTAKIRFANLSTECDKVKRLLEETQIKADQLAETRSAMERMKETETSMEKFLQMANEEKDMLKDKLTSAVAARGRAQTALKAAETQIAEKNAKIAALEKAGEGLKTRMYLIQQRMAEKVEWWQGQVGSQPQTAS